MKKERMSQILSILLLPYLEKGFCEEGQDVIENVRYSFAELRRRHDISNSEQKKRERDYYVSERKLILFFQNHKEIRPNNLDDLRMLLNLFFSESSIADIYDEFSENNKDCKHNIEIYYLHNIFRIAGSLLTFRDGEMAIRTWFNEEEDGEGDIFNFSGIFDKVEIWNLLCRKVVPDIFIAAFYVKAGLTEPCYLYGQTGRIMLADKTLERVLQKGIAETHLHMNAGINYELLWEYATTLNFWESRIVSGEVYEKTISSGTSVGFHIVIFRLVLAIFLEEYEKDPEKDICFQEFVSDEMTKELVFCLAHGKSPEYSKSWNAYYSQLIYYFREVYGDFQYDDFLMATIYRKFQCYETYSEMILMLKCINYLQKKCYDSLLLHLFFQYIREKNHFYSSIMESSLIQGLDNFQLYYGNMSRCVKKSFPSLEKKMEALFKSLCHNIHLKKLEVRIAPPAALETVTNSAPVSRKKDLKNEILESVKAVMSQYKKYILEIQASKAEYSVPTIGITFHFLKKDFVDNRIPDMCWIVKEQDKPIDSKHILQWRKQMVECAKAIEELRSEIPLLAEYIVGIDAASIENKTEPWIFAPVYAAIRNKSITKPLLFDEYGKTSKINNLGFTYHVGEEFRHVLSGLRQVEEVIKFFHYKAGDRIGHAIVLGIDVDKWVAENEVVVMPIIEYLEDLLWVWGSIVHEERLFDISLDVIEGKILELAKQIYGEIIGVTPNMLYDAYLEKFKLNNQVTFDKMSECVDVSLDTISEHFCRYYKNDNPYGIIWTKEKLLCTNFCPIYYQRLQQPILVRVDRKSSGFLKEMQNKVVQLVEHIGIYVEVNPTSNLVIGGTNSLMDSHIFGLNSRCFSEYNEGGHEVLVTINSDDPMVFNTANANELAYIYHALNHKGYSKERVLDWIDKVRQYGMDSSFIKRNKNTQEMLDEIEWLLHKINMFQKRI